MAPSSQASEPPGNPGRFNTLSEWLLNVGALVGVGIAAVFSTRNDPEATWVVLVVVLVLVFVIFQFGRWLMSRQSSDGTRPPNKR
jgi:hypothetical protein